MRVALICYHKNAENIYPIEWVDKFRDSILGQTYKDFDIFECEYGGGNFQVFNRSHYESIKLTNFAYAMNHLIDKCFARGYDCVANCNVDDWYAKNRLEKQLPFIKAGYDVVSSNFSLVGDDDKIVLTHVFDKLDIKEELEKDHNILCHPSIILSSHFWKRNKYIPSQIPVEDMRLWQRGIKAGYKFIITSDVLCFHRLHKNSVGHNLKEV